MLGVSDIIMLIILGAERKINRLRAFGSGDTILIRPLPIELAPALGTVIPGGRVGWFFFPFFTGWFYVTADKMALRISVGRSGSAAARSGVRWNRLLCAIELLCSVPAVYRMDAPGHEGRALT